MNGALFYTPEEIAALANAAALGALPPRLARSTPKLTGAQMTAALLTLAKAWGGTQESIPFEVHATYGYTTCSVDEMQRLLTWWKGSAEYRTMGELWNGAPDPCNDYGWCFKGMSELAGINSVVTIVDYAGGHCYNAWVDDQGRGWLIEPQYGTYVRDAPPGGEVGYIELHDYQFGALGSYAIV